MSIESGISIERKSPRVSLVVGRLPRRKSWVLYLQDSNIIEPLAYFISPEQAEKAIKFIAGMGLPEKRVFQA